MEKKKGIDTRFLQGVLAILIWALLPAVRRQLSESLSMFLSGGIVNLCSGVIMYVIQQRKEGFYPIQGSNPRFWILCALPYVLYSTTSLMSSGLAGSREGAVISSLFTSLWPLATLAFTVPILGAGVKKLFWAGCCLSVVGASFAALSGFEGSLWVAVQENGWAIFCGMLVPFTWALYSDYYCLLVRDSRADYSAHALIVSGLLQLLLAALCRERVEGITGSALLGLAFQILLGTVCANTFWNNSMQSKHSMQVILLSNLSPVLSTLCSCLLLGVELKWQVLLGSVVIVVATAMCKRCILPTETFVVVEEEGES